jgi:hypothetical protein
VFFSATLLLCCRSRDLCEDVCFCVSAAIAFRLLLSISSHRTTHGAGGSKCLANSLSVRYGGGKCKLLGHLPSPEDDPLAPNGQSRPPKWLRMDIARPWNLLGGADAPLTGASRSLTRTSAAQTPLAAGASPRTLLTDAIAVPNPELFNLPENSLRLHLWPLKNIAVGTTVSAFQKRQGRCVARRWIDPPLLLSYNRNSQSPLWRPRHSFPPPRDKSKQATPVRRCSHGQRRTQQPSQQPIVQGTIPSISCNPEPSKESQTPHEP